jgi:predicted ATP-grasp superfamily ATP-dependent carboligase
MTSRPVVPPAAIVFPDNAAALAVCRELGSVGVPVVVLSADGRGPGVWSRFATPVTSPDIYRDVDRYADFLVGAAPAWGRGAVLFPTEDAALLLVERWRERLAGVFRVPYAVEAAGSLVDKRRLHAAALAAGVAVPRTESVSDPEDAARFASGGWIVKPPCRYRLADDGSVCTLRSAVGPGKAVAGDVAQAVEALGRGGFTALVQEAIEGPLEALASVGLCLAPDGTVLAAFTARKRLEYPEPFGDGLVVETMEDPGLLAAARRLLAAAGYWGLCDLEFKLDRADGRYKLLDANPRPWLWIGLGLASGAPLVRAAYGLATGAPLVPAGARGAAGHRWISPRGAAGFLRRHYRPARHGLGLPLGLGLGLARQGLHAWRAFRDPLWTRGAAWRAALPARRRAATRPHPEAPSSRRPETHAVQEG